MSPPKDKPVVLVFGGSFNPPHMGHVTALKDAIRHVEKQGYKVAKAVVVPTADRLLKDKLGKRMYPLAERAELVKRTFADEPGVHVTTRPSEEAEKFTGKLRRTQLAESVGKMYEDHTVINVTGVDAAPGKAPPAPPAVYSGDIGSSHEGFYYAVVPRDDSSEGISSTKIRAAIAEGKEPPGMHPEAVKYLPEMFKKNPTIEGGPKMSATQRYMSPEAIAARLASEKARGAAERQRVKDETQTRLERAAADRGHWLLDSEKMSEEAIYNKAPSDIREKAIKEGMEELRAKHGWDEARLKQEVEDVDGLIDAEWRHAQVAKHVSKLREKTRGLKALGATQKKQETGQFQRAQRALQTGPRGGMYYESGNGKVYVKG